MNTITTTDDVVRTGTLRSVAPETGTAYSVVAASPRREPDLWHEYLSGADASYHRHGCAAALEYDEVVTGVGTALFYAVLDQTGKVVGGLRVQPRFDAAAQSHALVEWAGQPGQVQLVNAIEERLAGGIVEVKTAWVDERSPIAATVAGQLSRLGLVIMEMAGVDHMMATAADHVLRRWQSGGGRVDESVSPTPFPDERYRTRLMWWDRARLTEHTSPETWRRMRDEADALQSDAKTHRPLVRVSISTKSAGRR
ncbi:hypothetical protein IA539_11910 [Gordonia sp. zg691]|uniref:GNAT family N-acetyltransferase n=1 Tax=Gordonia jinghuaiqii TaxID=2758710 RepID=A0A7D7LUE2_9ACTN|nr:hypothetical protein [Gordonia jinghuaiqii]MBD0861915.1 hypothetical protein [Gordonia jinghuaiqii]MCR5977820.1 hypothetical protein [Gordonia jinghuaiqii]QMT02477.1 hypothetical protein H1R19_04795 [Gordonia jinghuaiqii]